MRDERDGFAAEGRELEGATPRKKPIVTMAAEAMTLFVGVDFDWRDDTKMVNGRSRPLAI